MRKSCCVLMGLWLSTAAIALTAKAEEPPPRPTETAVDPQAKGQSPDVLERLAEKFSKQSPQPKERLAQFGWLGRQDPYTRIKSWNCRIVAVSKQKDKWVWNVTIAVHPMLAGGGFALVLSEQGATATSA